MRKLIYSFMLAVAACMMFTACGDEPKTFSGTYTFSKVDADVQATAIDGLAQATIDYYLNMEKKEYLAEYREEFRGSEITVDGINSKAKVRFDGETEECLFVQENGQFTMSYDGELVTGTINDTELVITEDLTDEMADLFEEEATVDKFAIIITYKIAPVE